MHWVLPVVVGCSLLNVPQVGSCGENTIEQRLAQRDQSSAIIRFWRQKRSYPHEDMAQRLLLQNRPEQARKVYDAYLAADPDHLAMLWLRLQLIVRFGSTDEVINACSDLLPRLSDFGPLYAIRGQAYQQAGYQVEAANDFAQALSDAELTKEERLAATRSLIALRMQQKKTAEATRLCRELIEIDPEQAEHYQLYGDVLSRLGATRAAQQQWQKAADKTTDPLALRQLTLVRAGSLIEAKEDLRANRLLMSEETDRLFAEASLAQRFDLHLYRARSAATNRQIQHSLQQARAELDRQEDEGSVLERAARFEQLGDTAFDLQQFDSALGAYTEARASNPNPKFQLKAAQSAWHAGRYEQAATLLQTLPRHQIDSGNQQTADLLLCEAQEKLGQLAEAIGCLDNAMRTYPHLATIPAKAAQLAHDAGWGGREIIFLQRHYQHQPQASLAMNIGYLYRAQGQAELARQWFATAYQVEPSPKTGLTLVQHLFEQKRYSEVVVTAGQMRASFRDAPQEYARLLLVLAQSSMMNHEYAKAAGAWAEAAALTPSPQAILGRMEALHRLGRLEEAAVLSLERSQATTQEWLRYLDMRSALLLDLKREDEALGAFEAAVALEPTADRLVAVSMLAQKSGDWARAEDSVRQAERLDPTHLAAKKQLAFLLSAQERYSEAASVFTEVLDTAPSDPEINRALGYTLVQLGRNDEAVAAYGRAITAAHVTPRSFPADAEQLQAIKGIQDQVAELDRRFSYTMGFGGYLNHGEGYQTGWDQEQNANTPAYGIAELGYRPESFGYHAGKSSEMFGRLIWSDKGSVTGDDDSPYQAGAGARIKPLAFANVVLTTEALFSLKDAADNDLLVRLAHSSSHTAWQQLPREAIPEKGHRYSTSYAEIGTSLTGTVNVVYTAQGRYGRSVLLMPDMFFSPFVYGAVSGYDKDEGRELVLEGGGGIALNFFSAYDQLHGFRREGELVLRLGMASTSGDGVDDESFRAFIGLRLTGF